MCISEALLRKYGALLALLCAHLVLSDHRQSDLQKVFLSTHHDTIALVVYINTDVFGHSFGFKSSPNPLEKDLLFFTERSFFEERCSVS